MYEIRFLESGIPIIGGAIVNLGGEGLRNQR